MKTIKIQALIIFVILNSSFQYIHYGPISKQDYYTEILRDKNGIIKEIYHVNQDYNQDFEILICLSLQESGLNPKAVNLKNKNNSIDKGAFQLNSSYFNAPKIYDVKVNTFLGVSHFNDCIQATDSTREALYLYNSGRPYAVDEKAKKRADYIIQSALKLKYNYERYKKTYVVEYF